ncbi:MAG: hypothetical protein WDO73_35350 [Ignavibacteriota bacterium]
MIGTVARPPPRPPAKAPPATAAEFGGLNLVNYIQVDPFDGLLRNQQRGYEQK